MLRGSDGQQVKVLLQAHPPVQPLRVQGGSSRRLAAVQPARQMVFGEISSLGHLTQGVAFGLDAALTPNSTVRSPLDILSKSLSSPKRQVPTGAASNRDLVTWMCSRPTAMFAEEKGSSFSRPGWLHAMVQRQRRWFHGAYVGCVAVPSRQKGPPLSPRYIVGARVTQNARLTGPGHSTKSSTSILSRPGRLER